MKKLKKKAKAKSPEQSLGILPKDVTPEEQEIWDRFIKPFVKYFYNRAGETNVKKLVDLFFHEGDRVIKIARAKKKFKMPGALRQPPEKPFRGLKQPSVEYRDILYIGTDSTTGEIIIELPNETEYSLSQAEYNLILPFLEMQ